MKSSGAKHRWQFNYYFFLMKCAACIMEPREKICASVPAEFRRLIMIIMWGRGRKKCFLTTSRSERNHRKLFKFISSAGRKIPAERKRMKSLQNNHKGKMCFFVKMKSFFFIDYTISVCFLLSNISNCNQYCKNKWAETFKNLFFLNIYYV